MLRLIFDFLAGDNLNTNNPENVDTLKSIVEDSYSELCRKKIAIPDATVDQSIVLADTASEYLIVSCDQQITIKLNGSSDSITLKPKKAGTKNVVLFLRADVSALLLSNASGSICNVDILSVNIG